MHFFCFGRFLDKCDTIRVNGKLLSHETFYNVPKQNDGHEFPGNVTNITFQMLSEFEDEQKKFVKMQQRRQGK